MKNLNYIQTRLAGLHGQNDINKSSKTTSPFDEAIKGLGVSQQKRNIKKRKQVLTKI